MTGAHSMCVWWHTLVFFIHSAQLWEYIFTIKHFQMTERSMNNLTVWHSCDLFTVCTNHAWLSSINHSQSFSDMNIIITQSKKQQTWRHCWNIKHLRLFFPSFSDTIFMLHALLCYQGRFILVWCVKGPNFNIPTWNESWRWHKNHF